MSDQKLMGDDKFDAVLAASDVKPPPPTAKAKVPNLNRDPKVSHPKAGQAQRNAMEKRARMAAERACIIIAGRDRVLAEVARAEGEAVALEVAQVFGINPEAYQDGREVALQRTEQGSRESVDSWQGSPRHSPEVMAAILDPAATDADVQEAVRRATGRAASVARARAVHETREHGPVDVQRQVTTVNPALSEWGPDHDPRVMDALLAGKSLGEVAAIRQQVTQEYDDAAALGAQGKTAADVEAGLNRLHRTGQPAISRSTS